MAVIAYQDPKFVVEPEARSVDATFSLVNESEKTWRRDEGYSLGWQLFDPETGTFISEGEWMPFHKDIAPAETAQVNVQVILPPEKGHYHVYISPLRDNEGWFYQQGAPFLLLDAAVEAGRASLIESGVTTLASLRRRNFWRNVRTAFTYPFVTIWTNWSLIRSMVRRDILARYRGSFGDAFWAVLNPALLMITYFFVFGVVLQSRFAGDTSRSGFALYFLAGMLPWLPFSEAAGRAPHVMLEYRNFLKKLVFPVETLPVNQVIAGLVTEAFTLLVFLVFLLFARGSIPFTLLWLPVLLIPQMLFTLGVSWFLSALGVFVRDLGQVIGFLLTLWFFITPICYPETQLPPAVAMVLSKNPIYVLVRGYRSILLESHPPEFHSLWKLWLLAAVVFVLGHALFHKLRPSFADVI